MSESKEQIVTTPTKMASTSWWSSFVINIKDSQRWKKSLFTVVVWFILGWVVTTQISRVIPGHPIIVATNSIDAGLYWLDLRDRNYVHDDIVTFEFKPQVEWMKAHYAPMRHTKMIRGKAGDTVTADMSGRLKICYTVGTVASVLTPVCVSAGEPQKKDSKGRELQPWLKPGNSHTLKQNEVWIYGPNPRSLDSRYNGPVPLTAILGEAHPLLIWDPYAPN